MHTLDVFSSRTFGRRGALTPEGTCSWLGYVCLNASAATRHESPSHARAEDNSDVRLSQFATAFPLSILG